jgi:hypothetical protein
MGTMHSRGGSSGPEKYWCVYILSSLSGTLYVDFKFIPNDARCTGGGGNPMGTMHSRGGSSGPEKYWCVYILSSLSGTLYVGLADDLRRRMIQHKGV